MVVIADYIDLISGCWPPQAMLRAGSKRIYRGRRHGLRDPRQTRRSERTGRGIREC